MSKTIPVLDKGFVCLVDHMGNDKTVVKTARISFKQSTKDEEKDQELIFFLMQHGHESPFEHVVFTFHIKAPIFVVRQWFRHRIGSFNEVSGRYTEIEPEFYIPQVVRLVDEEKKIQISDSEVVSDLVRSTIARQNNYAYHSYERLLELGVPKELARVVLPLNTYTQFYWTVNSRSLMNFLNLRADSHAQFEMVEYAVTVAKIFAELCPITFDAFVKYGYKGNLDLEKIVKQETVWWRGEAK